MSIWETTTFDKSLPSFKMAAAVSSQDDSIPKIIISLYYSTLGPKFQGVDGVFVGGFEGGVEAEDEAGDDRDAEGDGEDLPGDEGGEGGDEADGEGESVAKDEAEEAAEAGEDEGFDEELEEDVGAGGADGLADADFVSAFGNRDEHDVHDADTADDEGDASDDGEDAGDDGEEGASGVSDFIASEDGEVGVAGFAGGEGIANFFGGRFEGVGALDTDVDLLDLKGVVDFVEGGGADKQGRVEVDVVEVDRVGGFGEDADDDEALAKEGDGFADGFGGAEEGGGEFGADDGGGGFGVFAEEGAVFEA